VLENSVFPRILASKTLGETLRIWVAACATGEEVYSIAMLLLESQRHKPGSIPFQIFATDLSEEAISKARLGEYSAQQLKNVSPRRIQQFFVKAKDKYRISKTLRDICVFARHNILNDPPFSRMDFISCRNFLIYLDAPAQKKAISTFNYALNAGGCLMLGKAETIGASAQLFTALDKKFKIYSRKNNSGPFKLPVISSRISFTTMPEANSLSTPGPKKLPAASNNTLGSAFDSILLAQYMPASVIINYDFEILQFRGSTAPYLQHSPGRASFNILKMAQAEITFELRNAIHHAIKTKQTICKTGIEMNRDFAANTRQIVNLEVTPLDIEGEEPLLIVVFSGHQVEMAEQSDSSKQNNSLAKDRRIKKLEEEIDAARSDMGSITHDQEAANEELQSANEEIVSSNEELQSLNEELETSKEEIESTNEELTTSNQELIARIQQVEELYAYYEAILATIHEPMVILDKNIQIKSANQAFCKMFHVTEGECLGISLYKLGNNQWNIQKLRELIEEIVPQNHRFHNFEVEHTFPVIGHKTMLLNAHRINQPGKNEELIVLTISDITEVKRLAVELQEKEKKALLKQLELEKKAIKVVEDSNKRYNMLLLQSPFAIAILKGKDMVITLANDSIVEMWGKGKDLIGKPLLEVLPELKENQFPHLLDDVYTTGMPFYGNELMATLYRNGEPTDAYFNFVYQPYREADESILGVTVISYDVTAQVMAKNELIEAKNKAEQATQIAEIAVKAKQQFLSNMSHEIRTPMNAIIGFTNVVLKTPLDESQKEYLNAIKVSGEALIVLINDILDLARVDSGKMSFEKIPFNLSASVATMLQLFGTKIKEKNLKLTEEYDQTIPAFLIGDPMRLRQIVINLLSNAVKFTEEGEISLRVRMLNETPEKATVEFALTDTGIGISEDKLGLIFNNFEQAAPGTGNIYGGSGLGLAIVKQFVELQGGSTFVHSQVGKGSTFGFVLDFEKTNPDTGIKTGPLVEMDFQSPLPETVLQDVKILVVEDIALNQLLIKIILLDFGFDVSVAANGKIAIENLKKDPFDIVLMDLHMPEMDGFEATDYIRHQMNSTIPIIALTADVTTLDNEKCLAVGMNDYISKPIDETLLYSKIIQCLKKSDPKKYLA
jgi:two-component system CheB/CheR fusion protein